MNDLYLGIRRLAAASARACSIGTISAPAYVYICSESVGSSWFCCKQIRYVNGVLSFGSSVTASVASRDSVVSFLRL